MGDVDELILSGRGAYERYKTVKDKGLLLFECVVGSTSYGTNIATSDVDKKFIYLDPLENVLNGTQSQQINITDDYVGYELGRYLGLLRTQNPNIIELINTDEQHIEFCHPLFREIVMARKDEFLTRQVAFSFGEYAKSQIKKAQGTSKKFLNPEPKERKTLMDFCYVGSGQGALPLQDFMNMNFGLTRPWLWGAVSVNHMKNTYHLFLDQDSKTKLHEVENSWETPDEMLCDYIYAHRLYNGVISSDGVNVRTASVAKGVMPVATFYCNIEGFQKHCKDHKQYWEWVEKSNKQRFVENAANEHQYDRKNMMHCHRLLDMCIEILQGKGVKVFRPNREELLGIRNGNSTYQELVDKAEDKYQTIKQLYETSDLPKECEKTIMQDILLEFRKTFYGIK